VQDFFHQQNEEYIVENKKYERQFFSVFPTRFAKFTTYYILTFWFYNVFFFAKKNTVVPTSLHMVFDVLK